MALMRLFRRYLPAALWALLIWYLTSIPQLKVVEQSWLQSLIMMSGHFIFFGIQAVLLPIGRGWSVITTSLYGLGIEFHQLYVPGRSFDLVDWFLDTLGAIVFLGILKKFLNHKS